MGYQRCVRRRGEVSSQVRSPYPSTATQWSKHLSERKKEGNREEKEKGER